MPKKTSKKNNPKLIDKVIGKVKSFYSKKPILRIGLTVLLIWGLIWCGQVAVERYSFYRAEKALGSITKQIEENFSLQSAEKNRSCGKRDHTFGESLGGCSVSYSYVVKGGEETARAVDDMIESRSDVAIFNPDPVLIANPRFAPTYTPNSSKSNKFSSTYKFRGSNLECGVSYTVSGDRNLYIYASCYVSGRDARLQYFPIGG